MNKRRCAGGCTRCAERIAHLVIPLPDPLKCKDGGRRYATCSRRGYKFHPGRDRTTKSGTDGLLRFLAALACDVFRDRRALICENALLRQQLIVAERKLNGRRVRWRPWER